MLAALAHDIRTPLTGILAIGELLAMSNLGERERGWVDALRSSAEHLTALTSLIIDGARAEERGLVLRHEPFDLRQTADNAAALAAARAETKGVAFSLEIASDLPARVIGDQVRLRGAIENLLDNAVKFTLTGSVRLEVGHLVEDGRHVVSFAVTDSGIGLTKQQIRRLFRPFSQADDRIAERFGGSGLGLVYVKRLARAMGGDVTVESVPGQGSTFCLTVRVDPAPPPNQEESVPLVTAVPTSPLHILCVEDNAYGRIVMRTVLGELGHVTDFVESGETAIETLSKTPYDVVLMDVVLAGIDGFEATRRIRALPGRAGQVPVIGLSGKSAKTHEAQALAAGMSRYLQKPVSPAVLASALLSVAEKTAG